MDVVRETVVHRVGMVRVLVEAGAAHSRDIFANRPLHSAAITGNRWEEGGEARQLVELLIHHGADLEAENVGNSHI